jgi:hypothetical protein
VGQVVACSTGTVNKRPVTALELPVGARAYRFGEFLSDVEKQWLAQTVNARVKECRRDGA